MNVLLKFNMQDKRLIKKTCPEQNATMPFIYSHSVISLESDMMKKRIISQF